MSIPNTRPKMTFRLNDMDNVDVLSNFVEDVNKSPKSLMMCNILLENLSRGRVSLISCTFIDFRDNELGLFWSSIENNLVRRYSSWYYRYKK